MGRVFVELTGDEARVVEAIRKMNTQFEKTETTIGKAAREASELERASKRVFENTRTPAERLNAELAKLDNMLAKGSIDATTHARAVEQVRDRYDEARREAKALAEEGRRVFESMRTPAERHADEIARLNRLLKAGAVDQETYNRAVRRSQDAYLKAIGAGRLAFGTEMQQHIRSMITGVLSLAAAQQLVVRALREELQMREDAARRQREQFFDIRQLGAQAQTPQEFRQLVKLSEDMFKSGVGRTREEASRMVFNLSSADLLEEAPFFTELGASGVVGDTTAIINAVSMLTANLGKKEVGTAEQVTSKLLGAGRMGLSETSEIADIVAFSAPQLRQLGVSDEEGMAAARVLTLGMSADQAKTAFRQMLVGLAESGDFKGKTLMESVRQIRGEELSPEELRLRLGGRVEAIQAFSALATPEGEEAFGVAMQDIAEADRTNLVRRSMQNVQAHVPTETAARATRAQRGLDVLVERTAAPAQNLMEAVLAESRAFERRNLSRGARFDRELGRGLQAVGRFLRSPFTSPGAELEGALLLNAGQVSQQTFDMSTQLLIQQNEISRRQLEQLQQMRREQMRARQQTPISTPALEQSR